MAKTRGVDVFVIQSETLKKGQTVICPRPEEISIYRILVEPEKVIRRVLSLPGARRNDNLILVVGRQCACRPTTLPSVLRKASLPKNDPVGIYLTETWVLGNVCNNCISNAVCGDLGMLLSRDDCCSPPNVRAREHSDWRGMFGGTSGRCRSYRIITSCRSRQIRKKN